MWARVAATAGEANERVGVSGVLGRLVGRMRALGGRRALWGWLGREGEQAWAAARLPPFFSFSVFFFSSLFEFKFGFGI